MNPSESLLSQPDQTPPAPSAAYALQEIQARVGGQLSGKADVVIKGVNALELAGPSELAFAESGKSLKQVQQSRAAAVIVPLDFPAMDRRTLLRVKQPRLAFVKAMYLFHPACAAADGVDRHAVVAPDASLGEGVTIRECAVIRPRARIGSRTVIESGAHIAEDVVVGDDGFIGPNVVIMRGCQIGHRVIIHGGTVIGADGFGYVWVDGRHLKIPQIGNVLIEDDVELGANVCVDRATMGSTIIRRGTKVDNLVQIAHNDVIGEHASLSGQVGLAGSVRIGDHAVLGGQVGVVDHVVVGERVRVGGGSIVTKDVPAGQTVWWFPARPIQRVKRELAALSFLPETLKRLNKRAPAARRPAKRS